MEQKTYDLGDLFKGSVVEVSLTAAANIILLDKKNLELYQRKLNYQCFNKFVKVSPFRAAVPGTSHWYLLVDQPPGQKSSVRVAPYNPNK